MIIIHVWDEKVSVSNARFKVWLEFYTKIVAQVFILETPKGQKLP